MPTDLQLFGIQLVCLALQIVVGRVGRQRKYLLKAWPRFLSCALMALSFFICGIIIGT